MDEIEDKDKSEFNAAIATLIRIAKLKDALAATTIDRDYSNKFIYLEAYYMELISIMTPTEIEDHEGKYKIAHDAYLEYNVALNAGKTKVDRNIVETIVSWEKDLRILEQKHNLNLLTRADPRYALSSRR